MSNNNMNKLDMKSKDMIQSNIKDIGKLFPNVIVETNEGIKIDFDILKQELSNDISNNLKERYQFTWAGRKQAMANTNKPINKTLRPLRDKSLNFDKTKNIYIEGDNLDTLKILQESYLNKIKCIYIDPPYNTGNDFIYNDTFINNEELEMSGQIDEYNNKLISNANSNGRYHSKWLSMMYPRLKIARNCMKEDGVCIISIDDNEYANLVKLCILIFGENNVETMIWNKEAEGSSGTLKQTLRFRRVHEYIVICYKNKSIVTFGKIHEALKGKEKQFQTANLAVNTEKEKRDHANRFDIISPNGTVYNRQWKFSKAEIDKLIKENLIYWGSDGNKQPRLIIPTDERRTVYLQSIINKGGTTIGRKDFENLMGECEFSYPKPVSIIKDFIEVTTEKDSIVMDFFSGTSTTAQAIIQLNKEDGGHRKFIMVQLPERCDENSLSYKNGYKTICDIGENRIKNTYKSMKFNKATKDSNYGFRVYSVDSSNMKDIYYQPKDLKQSQLNMFEVNIKEDRTAEDLLIQVMLDLGLTLDLKMENKKILKNNVYFVENNSLVACFDDEINIKILKKMLKDKPLKIVFKETAFKTDNDKINIYQTIKELSSETQINII